MATTRNTMAQADLFQEWLNTQPKDVEGLDVLNKLQSIGGETIEPTPYGFLINFKDGSKWESSSAGISHH